MSVPQRSQRFSTQWVVKQALVALATVVLPATAMAGGGTFMNTGADSCADSQNIVVEIGPVGNPATTTVFGDTTGATSGGCPLVIGASWWERFELTEPARVQLDLCGTTPVHTPDQTDLFLNCTGTSCSDRVTGTQSTCPDGNLKLDFRWVLNTGTYYYPIRGSTGQPYEMHITAEAVPPLNSGPDVVAGEIATVEQLGREGAVGGGIVGLGVTSADCNVGDVGILVEPLPATRHRLIEANLYRLSEVGGSSRLEQLGQSWLKHTFGPAWNDACGVGCRLFDCADLNSELCPGCSDTYVAIQFAPCDLGPRSAVHPFTSAMPGGADVGSGGDCASNFPANNHIGHDHPHTDLFDYFGIKHRLQVRDVDLDPTQNPGARYFAEVAYLTPDEYLFQNGNQNNNVSHREFSVAGPDENGVFSFAPLSDTFRESPAIDAWPGAMQAMIEPYPAEDGRAFIAYEVTDLGNNVWRYEYVLYNMNMDASIGRFRVPVPTNVNIQNIGFHAPLAHAPELNAENYSTSPWSAVRIGEHLTFATDDFTVDPLANAVRYGTAYNFRFDADTPPAIASAEVALFKTAQTVAVSVQAPSAPIPAASHWIMLSFGLLVTCAGTVLIHRRARADLVTVNS